MKKPPIKKLDQTDYVKTTLRLPPDLHKELLAGAERAGRSLNAEILARLQGSDLKSELGNIKSTLREILDAVT